MTQAPTGTLYRECEELFTHYPQASRTPTRGLEWETVILVAPGGGRPQFFTLGWMHSGDPVPFFMLGSWASRTYLLITEDGAVQEQGISASDAAQVLREATPLPQHGSLFGWTPAGRVTALIAVYADSRGEYPEPSWAVMPLAGTPATQWPPFSAEQAIGPWFWEYLTAGQIIDIGAALSDTRRTAWWVTAAGSQYCAVTRDVALPRGVVLPRGLFAWHEELSAGTPVPSLPAALASTGKRDLGVTFREAA
jgi:hypothetical protein